MSIITLSRLIPAYAPENQRRINEVAEYLQIPRKKLYLRMRKYGLSKEHYKF
ncbi:MAG: hypothetical protein RSA84_07560 [Acinetobacter sp.]